MPAPYRDPDSDLRQLRALHIEGRPPNEAQKQARYRRDGPCGEPGVMQPVWAEIRNGVPLPRPYVHAGQDGLDAVLAAPAWHQVAVLQARLRGEPPPAPVPEPWNLPPCPRCGFRMRCGCRGGAR